MKSIVLLIAMIFFVVGCANHPTKTFENQQRNMKPSAADSDDPVKITEQTVVIDARPAFEYSLSHIPQAINVQWTDFTQQEPSFRGVLLADRFELARRLARLGISPDSDVVVVGNGIGGHGQEGRLAWTLAYLGVKNVRTAPMSYFKGHLNNTEAKPLEPAPIWKPALDETLLVTRDELLFVLKNKGMFEPVAFGEDSRPRLYKIVDVRSAREYLGKEGIGMQTPIPNMEAINIPWDEFFDANGFPSADLTGKLADVGVTTEQRVILLSERGDTSAAATIALRSLGYTSAGNYAGGLQELVTTVKASGHKPLRKRK